MRYVRSRAQVSQACYRAPNGMPEHTVQPNACGWFDVLSARSGNTYKVRVDGTCSCPGYQHHLRCSHLAAVLEYAAAVLAAAKRRPQ